MEDRSFYAHQPTLIKLGEKYILRIFMHRKAIFFLAGIFLTVALVASPVILFLQSDNDLDNYIVSQNPNGLQTNGNITILTPEEIQENHNTTFILVAVIETVFIILFTLTLYIGINHTHPHQEH
jgi:hypothetical protein